MKDFADIARLEALYFEDAWSRKMLEDTFEYDYNHLLMEKRDGKVVGYIIYSDVQGEAELQRIAVDKSYRRRGIADTLMRDMLSELEESGAERVMLEVRAHNTSAISLYKKYGFKDIFIRKDYYHNPDDDALIFQKSL
ncbi:MAG: ribosomal protein S18-alanine N-acetyltransferase [Eubacterium sp.]|nr:ribosomal protein S18-alanine N-acetyltransferase [Eubacterium sp.]